MKWSRKTDRQTVQQIQIEVMHSSIWQKHLYSLCHTRLNSEDSVTDRQRYRIMLLLLGLYTTHALLPHRQGGEPYLKSADWDMCEMEKKNRQTDSPANTWFGLVWFGMPGRRGSRSGALCTLPLPANTLGGGGVPEAHTPVRPAACDVRAPRGCVLLPFPVCVHADAVFVGVWNGPAC